MSDDDLRKIIEIATDLLEHRMRTSECVAQEQTMLPSDYASMMSQRGCYDYDRIKELKRVVIGV